MVPATRWRELDSIVKCFRLLERYFQSDTAVTFIHYLAVIDPF